MTIKIPTENWSWLFRPFEAARRNSGSGVSMSKAAPHNFESNLGLQTCTSFSKAPSRKLQTNAAAGGPLPFPKPKAPALSLNHKIVVPPLVLLCLQMLNQEVFLFHRPKKGHWVWNAEGRCLGASNLSMSLSCFQPRVTVCHDARFYAINWFAIVPCQIDQRVFDTLPRCQPIGKTVEKFCVSGWALA